MQHERWTPNGNLCQFEIKADLAAVHSASPVQLGVIATRTARVMPVVRLNISPNSAQLNDALQIHWIRHRRRSLDNEIEMYRLDSGRPWWTRAAGTIIITEYQKIPANTYISNVMLARAYALGQCTSRCNMTCQRTNALHRVPTHISQWPTLIANAYSQLTCK